MNIKEQIQNLFQKYIGYNKFLQECRKIKIFITDSISGPHTKSFQYQLADRTKSFKVAHAARRPQFGDYWAIG